MLVVALLAAADPSRCLAFDLLLRRPARPTAVITVVGAEVVGVSAAVGVSILAEFVLLSLPLAAFAGAAGRREAAWSCMAAIPAAVAAQQRGGYRRAAWARRPRVPGGSSGDARLACSPGMLSAYI